LACTWAKCGQTGRPWKWLFLDAKSSIPRKGEKPELWDQTREGARTKSATIYLGPRDGLVCTLRKDRGLLNWKKNEKRVSAGLLSGRRRNVARTIRKWAQIVSIAWDLEVNRKLEMGFTAGG